MLAPYLGQIQSIIGPLIIAAPTALTHVESHSSTQCRQQLLLLEAQHTPSL
jgi:hypothetical protein